MLVSSLAFLATAAMSVHAFPSFGRPTVNDVDLAPELLKRTECIANVAGLKKIPDAAHPFIAPRPTDQRGPCPGLNTLANHGYIPRSGIVNKVQTIAGCVEGFNMDPLLAEYLFALAVIYTGDPLTLSYSIGGPDPRTSIAGLATGYEGGLNYHAGIEGDASPTRWDIFFGDNHSLQPSLYSQMKSAAAKYGGLYTEQAVKEHAQNRFHNSIATNPNFTFIPVSGPNVIAANVFIWQFFSNGTYGAGGCANEASISAIYGAQTQSDGTIKRVPERFAENWYQRATPFTLTEALLGIVDLLTTTDIKLGANAGKTNSFVPLDVPAALDVNGLACILKAAVLGNLPSPLISLFVSVIAGLDSIFAPYGCPLYNVTHA